MVDGCAPRLWSRNPRHPPAPSVSVSVFAGGSLAEVSSDDACELVGHGLDAGGVGALDHDARERLGAGVADEDATAAVHLALEGADALAEAVDGIDGRLPHDGNVDEDLGKLPHAGG